MPISQDRVLALLDEIQGLIDKINTAREATEALAIHEPTIAKRLNYLAQVYLTEPKLLAFLTEARHFKSVARKNVRIREQQERKRRSKGIEPRPELAYKFADLVKPRRSYNPADNIPTQDFYPDFKREDFQEVAEDEPEVETPSTLPEELWKIE
jgi:hypothetical protein